MAGATILVIEDDAIQREAVVRELRRHGFTVVAAAEGNDALNRLSQYPAPDLILLDMLIPCGGHDGWWFLKQKQRIAALSDVPVLIMTSLSVASEAWAVSLGAAGLIRKPFDIPSLLGDMQRWLGSTSHG